MPGIFEVVSRRIDKLLFPAQRLTEDQREAISLAYGLLWRFSGEPQNVALVQQARAVLFNVLTAEEQVQGINAAKVLRINPPTSA